MSKNSIGSPGLSPSEETRKMRREIRRLSRKRSSSAPMEFKFDFKAPKESFLVAYDAKLEELEAIEAIKNDKSVAPHIKRLQI